MDTRITGGSARGRKLRPSKSSGLRPTSERVRAAIFSMLGPDAVEGARALDLYAGTGALGLEALSRDAAWVDFVESDAVRAQQIRESLRELGLSERAKVYRVKVERLTATLEGGYDLVFADPPYEASPWDDLMTVLVERRILNENALVVAEHSHRLALAVEYGKSDSAGPGLTVWKDRRYGDTAVTIYRFGESDGERHLSG